MFVCCVAAVLLFLFSFWVIVVVFVFSQLFCLVLFFTAYGGLHRTFSFVMNVFCFFIFYLFGIYTVQLYCRVTVTFSPLSLLLCYDFGEAHFCVKYFKQ